MQREVTMKKKVIIPLSSRDFDPSEVAIPWMLLNEAGHEVEFATVDGKPGYPDPIMLTGEGLDPWGWIPGLKKIKLLGLTLRANRAARAAYKKLEADPSFQNPLIYESINSQAYHGILLAGGHAPGMRAHLENLWLQNFVAEFFESETAAGNHKPVAAICHGVLIAARAKSKGTGKSVLFGRRTTALTWNLERTAWMLTKYLGRFWDPSYYRTYMEFRNEPSGYRSTEYEIKRCLEHENDFLDVPEDSEQYFMKSSGLFRDDIMDSRAAWVVQDGHYISARWPGDVHTFTLKFIKALEK